MRIVDTDIIMVAREAGYCAKAAFMSPLVVVGNVAVGVEPHLYYYPHLYSYCCYHSPSSYYLGPAYTTTLLL